jgi:hypothetical protein
MNHNDRGQGIAAQGEVPNSSIFVFEKVYPRVELLCRVFTTDRGTFVSELQHMARSR